MTDQGSSTVFADPRSRTRPSAWAVVLLTLLMVPPSPSAEASDSPAEYCRRMTDDDTPRPVPAPLAADARRLFGLDAPDDIVEQTTVFRCMAGQVMICTTGANLPCGKLDGGRALTSARHYCRENPDAPFIPMVVTGHDTLNSWRCRAGVPEAAGPPERLDARGFIARLWRMTH